MQIVGMHFTTNDKGVQTTTLHLMESFDSYYADEAAGRGCAGKKVSTVYIGNYDCSQLRVGMEIEIFYDRAITTGRGTFQPVKKIEQLTKTN